MIRVDRGRLVLAAVAALLFATLAVLVATRRLEGLDDRFRDWYWPSRHWGSLQESADDLAKVTNPVYIAVVVLACALVMSVRSRALRPVLLTLAVVTVAGVGELAVKWLMPRVAISSESGHFVGSFPSGHVVAAIAFPGALLLARRAGSSVLWWILVAAFGLLMSAAVLIAVLHYLTDVVGGVLLSVGVLAAAGAVRTDEPVALAADIRVYRRAL